MKKLLLTLTIVFSLAIALTGYLAGTGGAADESAGEGEDLPLLNSVPWPTPPPATPAPLPTPFPKFTLPTATAPSGEAAAPAGLEPVRVEPSDAAGLPSDAAQPAALTVSASPIANPAGASSPAVVRARVESAGLNVRQGPGAAYERLAVLAQADEVTVLGLNQNRDWVLVKTANGRQGWVALTYLAVVDGSLADAPLAAAPIAPASPATETAPQGQLSSVSTNAGSGKLVFQLASGGDIMVINTDGSGLRRLTSGIDPVLSPDGQTVAFTRWQGETGSLWLINIDGANERSILDFTRQAKGPDWSPDGSRIVLNFQQGGRLEEKLVRVDLTQDPNPRVPLNAGGVRVHVDGRIPTLKYTLPPDPHWSLRVVNVADGRFEDLDGGTYAFRPAWDPAQSWRIISDGGLGLVEVDVNSKSRRRLTDKVGDGSPVFSPDGRYLAVTFKHDGGYDIDRLNGDGSGRVRLTQTPLWVTAMPDNPKPWNNVSPAWSPDGSQIAFLTDRTGRWEIWVMSADGSNQRPMFSEAVNDQLPIRYDFADERVLSWRKNRVDAGVPRAR
ncbi:MAG: PD40 domain-containing protein [Anaerolineae bacterium]|nr:PD40 domain-containing protein [Anaerolineae bacterium]